MRIIKQVRDYVGWKYFDFITNQEMKYENSKSLSKTEEYVTKEIFDMIQELIEEEELEENWTSDGNKNRHFKKHCTGKNKNKSTFSDVRYDFITIRDFEEYSNKAFACVTSPDFRIALLSDTERVFSALKSLSQTDTDVLFTSSCGFENRKGLVNIGIHSFSNSVTTNYGKDTIDVIIFSNRSEIISVYPIDVSKINSKFKSIVKKYSYDEEIKELYKNA